MRVTIAGGNSFIGKNLTRRLLDVGHHVTWLSHRPGRARQLGLHTTRLVDVAFEPADPTDAWANVVNHANAVINLSGYPIASRWNDRTRALIRSSRIDTTRALVDAIGRARSAGHGPEVLVNASGAGIYGDHGDVVIDESTPPAAGFLGELAAEWESEAFRAREFGVRVVTVRTAPVIGEEGFLPRMVLPMRLFAGGPLGSGRQWMPWIHIDDIVGVYLHAIETPALDGPVDGVTASARMRDLAHTLGRIMHRPAWLPVPLFALRMVMGPVAPHLLESQRLEGTRLRDAGFSPSQPDLEGAMRDALSHL